MSATPASDDAGLWDAISGPSTVDELGEQLAAGAEQLQDTEHAHPTKSGAGTRTTRRRRRPSSGSTPSDSAGASRTSARRSAAASLTATSSASRTTMTARARRWRTSSPPTTPLVMFASGSSNCSPRKSTVPLGISLSSWRRTSTPRTSSPGTSSSTSWRASTRSSCRGCAPSRKRASST